MESQAHRTLTNESVRAAVSQFPPALRWLRKYLVETAESPLGLSDYNVARDYRDIIRDIPNIVTFQPKVAFFGGEGQKRHFMRTDNQSPTRGYQAAMNWIHCKANEAAEQIHKVLQERRVGHPSLINQPLGDALHTLQESFSEGHVSRKKVGDKWVIVDVFVYDWINKETHDELDAKWKTDLRGKEAITAGRDLIKMVVDTSQVEKTDYMRLVWKVQWGKFVSKFFQQDLSAADRAWDESQAAWLAFPDPAHPLDK